MKIAVAFLLVTATLYAGSITAVGDVMLGSNYPDPGMLDSCPVDSLQVLQEIPKTPIVFCNMEGTLLDGVAPLNSAPIVSCLGCLRVM